MIPVRYTGNLEPYDKFIRDFVSRVNAWCERGFIYRRADLSEAGIRMLRLLMRHMDFLANADACKLERIIRVLQARYPDLTDTTGDLSRTVYRVFVKNGYEHADFPANDLVRATGVRVCPYCNRVFVESVKGVRGHVRGQLDHFYPKEKYPYLAVSRHNLVPSCSYCNGPSGKHSADPYAGPVRMVNPYALADHRGLRFRMDILRPGFLDLDTMAGAIDIRLDTSALHEMDGNVDVLNLKALYDTHRDHAAEVYFKHIAVKTDAYRNFLKEKWGIGISPADAQTLYWGMPVSDDRLGSRPLAKFTRDLIDDLDGI